MTVTQPSLFDQPTMPTDPDARRLVEYLRRAEAWRTRADIEQDLGMDDRQIRLARDAAGSLVIIGHRGFKHALIATPEERGKHLDFFRKQGKGNFRVMSRDAEFFRLQGCEVLWPEAHAQEA